MEMISPPGLADATFGIVCALPKELSAIRAVFECVADPTSEKNSSDRKYALAELSARGGGRHVVAVALLPEMGNNAAAIRATYLLNDCPNVVHLLMVGIAGAVPQPEKPESHVRLGDIVVSDRSGVIQYDLVKETGDGAIEHRNAPRAPSGQLLEAMNWLRSDEDLGVRPWETLIERAAERLGPAWKRPAVPEDVLDDSDTATSPISHPHDPERRPGQPRVFHGPIAAANVLLKNADKRDDLRNRFGAKAVEMEGSGIADAAGAGRIGYLVIRGTCDYCNRNKNDAWQKYAAVIAAAYARALISSIPSHHGGRSSRAKLNLTEVAGTTAAPPDPRFLYEKGFEHGRLAGQLIAVPGAEENRAATGLRMLDDVQQTPTALAPSGALSSPVAGEELLRKMRLIRGHLDSYDHDLARDLAQEIERPLAEHADLIPPASRREALELLTDVAIIDFKRVRQENAPGASTAKARGFFSAAKEVSGDLAEADAWIVATEAYLNSLEEGAESGLGRLEGRNDAQATRRRLAILIDHERFADAAGVARDMAPERDWCEKAVSAFAQVGDVGRAKELIRWAGKLEDRAPRRRSILCYAESRFVAVFARRGKDEAAIPGSLDESERQAVGDVLETLTPVLQVAVGNERVVDALEEHIVRLALHSRILLGHRTEAESLAELLATRRPVSLPLAHLVLGASLPFAPDLPRRLREDHPGSYEASRLAFLLEAKDPSKISEALEKALKIDSDSLRKEDRPRHFYTLYSLARDIGEEAIKKVERLAPGLLAPDLDSLKLFLADRYLTSDRTEAARAILEELHAEDDPRWLQLYAHLMHRSGEPDEAMQRLLQASRSVPESDLFRQIARIAHGLGRFDVVTEVLRKVIALDPTDTQSRINYAGALTKAGDPEGAAEQFRILREKDPEDPWHAFNQAASLAHAGQLDAALAVYEDCCRAPSPRLEAVLGRAETLRLNDRPAEAFDSLDNVKGAWWEEPKFVLLYMSIAYAAGLDRQGNLALGRLIELQRITGTPGEILKTVSLDELKRSFADRRAHEVEVGELLLRGQVPWIMVEEGRGRVPYLGWSIRTQPLAWCPDGTHARAEFSLYSTNGFFVAGDGADSKEVERIECPDPGGAVAIDLSALFTLHSLDLLDAAAGYFGKIMVPAVYLDRVLEERSRLQAHQLSQRTSLEQVRSAIDAGRIRLGPGGSADASERDPLVDEYAEESPDGVTMYRALDVIEPLYARGRVTRDDFDRAKQAFSRRPGSASTPPTLFAKLDIDLPTLLTLAQIGCLKPVLESFQVGISRRAETEVSQGLREYVFRDKVRTSHADLWSRVRAGARFVITPAFAPRNSRLGDPEEMSGVSLALGASWIAAREAVPLLADDRVIQVVTQNEVAGVKPVAFGTDRLIERLQELGAITKDRGIDATLQLMRWRYRFVLPSVGLLKDLLDRYRENPPGGGLREMAEYVHDCMRDPGLFSGFEPTSPPTSMASRLRQGWITTVVQFVTKVWDDSVWSEASAREVTRWATVQLLPALPSTMPGPLQGALARLEHRTIMSLALIASSVVKSPERANACLLTIAEALGMREEDLHETLADVIADRA